MKNQNLFKEYKGIFEKVEETSNSKDKKERVFGYSPFAMQDALGEKNVKKIWLEYEKLRFAGIEAEDLVYKIINKVRDMAAISAGATKEDLNIKDYPYNKSKRDLKNWKGESLKDFYTKLVETHCNSRMGGEELATALEKTILNI